MRARIMAAVATAALGVGLAGGITAAVGASPFGPYDGQLTPPEENHLTAPAEMQLEGQVVAAMQRYCLSTGRDTYMAFYRQQVAGGCYLGDQPAPPDPTGWAG